MEWNADLPNHGEYFIGPCRLCGDVVELNDDNLCIYCEDQAEAEDDPTDSDRESIAWEHNHR